MRNKIICGTGLLALVFALLLIMNVADKTRANSAPQQITKWEYYTYGGSSEGPSEKILNELGADGWELVSIDPRCGREGASPRYVFKRPKR